MSKRNLIILIIVLLILGAGAFFYFYFYKGKTTTGTDSNNNSYAGFGNNTQNSTGGDGSPSNVSGYLSGDNTVDIKLKKVSSMPIAGFGVYFRERFKEIPIVTPPTQTTTSDFDNEEDVAPIIDDTPALITKNQTSTEIESLPAVRYVARATGNIYQTFADKIKEQKFSSTIIPKIYDAYFSTKAESVTMRYLSEDGITINTFAGSLPKEILSDEINGTKELRGSFLPENISDISLSADMSKIFYLFNSADNNFVSGVISGIMGDNESKIFSSPFTEWLSQWPNQNMITLTTKPAASYPGYMYAINPIKKDFTKVIGGIHGLTTLTSPDGKLVLYNDDTLALNVYTIQNKNIINLPIRSLPEKCVWGKTSDVLFCAVPNFIKNGSYPDMWYKGEVSFSDQIWKINVADGSATMIMDPVTFPGGEDIDGIKLTLDTTESFLFFMNKKDYFLWEFNLY